MPLRPMGRHSHSATGVDTVAFSGTTHHTTACSRPWTRWGSGSERREKGRGVSLALALAVPPTGERSRLSESLGLQHPPMEGGVGLGAAPELDHALRSLLHPSLLRVVAHLRPHRYIAVRVACWAVRLQFAVRHLSPTCAPHLGEREVEDVPQPGLAGFFELLLSPESGQEPAGDGDVGCTEAGVGYEPSHARE